MFRSSRLDKLLAKSTSELLMEADWETNLTICDLVRGQEITPKEAINGLKKRLNPDNPHVLLLALSVLEALMKNCGTPVHDEVCGTDFVMNLLEYTHLNEEVRSRIFGFIQNWEYAFKKNENYHYLHEAFKEIKKSGFPLPPFRESEAMFSAEVAPNWKDGDECFHCKSTFTTFRRKHHCRNCGNVFCGECTTGRAVIPKFGIEREVRVCDICLHEIARSGSSSNAGNRQKRESKPGRLHTFLEKIGGSGYAPYQQQQHQHQQSHQQLHQQHRSSQNHSKDEAAAKAAKEKELRLREEEDLQLALALSASEAESKQLQHRQGPTASQSAQPQQQQIKPPTVGSNSVALPTLPPPSDAASDLATEVDPELARYLNRNYWAGRAASAECDSFLSGFSPSAPAFPPPVNPDYVPSVVDPASEKPQEMQKALASLEMPAEGSVLPGVPPLTTPQLEEFLTALRKSLDVFTNRMRVCSQRGRPVATDSTLQTLFRTLHQMNLQLMQYSNDLESRRTSLEKLQDQTAQIREAREALDDLRRDYAEQRRREEEEAHRQRQILMMQKVEILRQQKRDAMEAQSRQLMEQSMAYQQHYNQYGYGQSAVYTPMMPYGTTMPVPPQAPSMGYAQPSEYYTASYDLSQPQMPEGENPSSAVLPPSNGLDGQQQHQPTRAPEVASEEPFNMQNMIQAMPPPSVPRVDYIQPSGPSTDSTNLIDQLPAPPTDELRVNPLDQQHQQQQQGPTNQMKTPTPQLICLE